MLNEVQSPACSHAVKHPPDKSTEANDLNVPLSKTKQQEYTTKPSYAIAKKFTYFRLPKISTVSTFVKTFDAFA